MEVTPLANNKIRAFLCKILCCAPVRAKAGFSGNLTLRAMAHPLSLLAASFLLPAAIFGTAVSQENYEQFETCYGSFQGASTVFPQIEAELAPADHRDLVQAMTDLAETFGILERKFAAVGLTGDTAARNRDRLVGRLPWTKAESHTLRYWSANGPMSRPCFELIKMLNQTLGP
jgi:hypothetical protein